MLSPRNFVSPYDNINGPVFSKEGYNAQGNMEEIAAKLYLLQDTYDLYICSQNYIENLKKYMGWYPVIEIYGNDKRTGRGVNKAGVVGILASQTSGSVYFIDDSQDEIDNVRPYAHVIKINTWEKGDPEVLGILDEFYNGTIDDYLVNSAMQLRF